MILLSMIPPPPSSTLFPYTTLFRSLHGEARGVRGGDQLFRTGHSPGVLGGPLREVHLVGADLRAGELDLAGPLLQDRKSTRLNSSHPSISYAVFCLKKKNKLIPTTV